MIGRYKYICDDCKKEQTLTRRERASKFKPRCISCGSPFLSPSKRSKAKKDFALHNAARGFQQEKFQQMNAVPYKKKGN